MLLVNECYSFPEYKLKCRLHLLLIRYKETIFVTITLFNNFTEVYRLIVVGLMCIPPLKKTFLKKCRRQMPYYPCTDLSLSLKEKNRKSPTIKY